MRKNDQSDPLVSILSKAMLSDNGCSSELTKKIGIEIKDFRQGHGLSQSTFADKIGISTRQVQRIESGDNNMTITLLYLVLKTIEELSLSKINNRNNEEES